MNFLDFVRPEKNKTSPMFCSIKHKYKQLFL